MVGAISQKGGFGFLGTLLPRPVGGGVSTCSTCDAFRAGVFRFLRGLLLLVLGEAEKASTTAKDNANKKTADTNMIIGEIFTIVVVPCAFSVMKKSFTPNTSGNDHQEVKEKRSSSKKSKSEIDATTKNVRSANNAKVLRLSYRLNMVGVVVDWDLVLRTNAPEFTRGTFGGTGFHARSDVCAVVGTRFVLCVVFPVRSSHHLCVPSIEPTKASIAFLVPLFSFSPPRKQ